MTVADDPATLATGRALPPTRTGLPPAGSRQLRLAHANRRLSQVLTCVYVWPIWLAPKRPNPTSGIYRNWPVDRIETSWNEVKLGIPAKVKRLRATELSALRYGAYFSLLSAFHIGWRDLNVGTWIARIQAREYALRATGWSRVISGLQSLLSVYLLAIWAQTYFGRPFQ
jgi:hypothetical protein